MITRIRTNLLLEKIESYLKAVEEVKATSALS